MGPDRLLLTFITTRSHVNPGFASVSAKLDVFPTNRRDARFPKSEGRRRPGGFRQEGKRMKKTILALMAVAIMVLSPVIPAGEDADASDVSTGPLASEPKEYMYAITTDANNMNITKVRASENGSAMRTISEARTAGGASEISGFWDFDPETGTGSFNSFYAAINIEKGSGYDNGEQMLNFMAGTIAFVLDPYDLSKTLNGTTLDGTYNIMLVIPTVYWKATSTNLYLSSSPSYTAGGSTVSGMKAYAHTAMGADGVDSVYPYIAIGVYEASVSDGRMLSASGAKPKAGATNDEFKSYADALTPASGSDYQQWNFYQWTLYKMMSYTVMGTKNSQAMLGDGPATAYIARITGLADSVGPYADATREYSKLFIENSWGSYWEFVGDTCFYKRTLYAGNVLGGQTVSDHPQAKVLGAVLPSEDSWIGAAYTDSAFWDLPKSTRDWNGYNRYEFSSPGDIFRSRSGWSSMLVSGDKNSGDSAGIALANADYNLSGSYSNVGSRLAYVMGADAASLAFEQSGLIYQTLPGSSDVSLIGYSGSPADVLVPESVTHGGREFNVVSIGEKAFYGCKTVETVDLGPVKSVGAKAFARCAGISEIGISDSLEAVGPYAFYGCASLKSLAISGEGVAVSKCAFYGCTGLESVTFAGSGATIGNKAFYNCRSLASLDLSGVSEIGFKAFPYCSSLTELTICGTVSSVGEYAFYGCDSLASVVIEDGVAGLARSAFSECRAITSLEVGGGLTEVGPNAFYGLAFRDAGGEALAPTAENLRGHAFAGSSMILDMVS